MEEGRVEMRRWEIKWVRGYETIRGRLNVEGGRVEMRRWEIKWVRGYETRRGRLNGEGKGFKGEGGLKEKEENNEESR